MPLFYIAKAHILYMINPKNPKVKEQFKNGLRLLNDTDILAINTTCDVAITTKLVDEVIKFLLSINLSPYLKIRLTEFLINKSSLEKREINKLEELKEEIEKTEIDVNFIEGILLVKQGKKEMTIGIIKQEDGTEILAKHEMEMNDRISFWADIYKCINMFNVEDVESVKDEILNIDRGEYFDKVRFDLIELSRKKDIPYICDDLLIRKIAAGVYHVKHTNCIVLIERAFRDNYDKYIDMVIQLAKCNYIYVLYNGKYIGNIIVYLYQNYGEELKKKYEVLLAEILKTKSSFNSYISILINMINNLKSVQYTKIFENVYINTRIQDIINMITEKLKMACQNFEYDFSDYEKYITKDYGGIELKI